MPLPDRSRVATARSGNLIPAAISRDWRDYLTLAKPEISFLVSISALAGFVLGSPDSLNVFKLVSTVVATTLAAAGACALNHAIEAERDAVMKRTAMRPVAAGRLSVNQAYLFGVGCIIVSASWLCPLVNAATAGLAVLTVLLYVYVYTPLKTRTSWNTIVGTIPGALPALGGFVAATNDISSPVGWSIFAVLAFWQLPHFYSLAWMYRKDYDRGEYKMISIADPSGHRTAAAAVAGCVGLVLATVVPFILGASGILYLIGSLAIGAWLFGETVRFAVDRTSVSAKRLLKASVVYIPIYVLLLVADHVLAI